MIFGRNALLFGLLAILPLLAGGASAHPLEVGDPGYGRLREVVFPSPTYGDVSLLVYTPPGYFAPGDHRRFPVIYWLHGSGATHLQLEQALAALPVAGSGAAARLDALVAAGQIPPLLMVAIKAPGGQWTDAETKLVTAEVPAFVDSSYRTVAKRSGRGLEGFSLGSQGVSIYGTARPDLYASTALLGGAFYTPRWQNAQAALLREGSEVYLMIGEADPNFSSTAAFSTELAGYGIPRIFDVVPGTGHHHVALYAARGVELLRWHAARFAATRLLDAGADLEIQQTLPATVSLAGALEDPHGVLGPAPALAWTQAGGPGTAVLDSPAAIATTAHLPAAGTYHFRLEAQGLTTVADVVRVQAVDLEQGLALHLEMEDLEFLDSSGNGHHGSGFGVPTVDGHGRFAKAIAFDGADDYLTVPDFNYGPAFSLALWIKAANLTGSDYHYVFSHNAFDAAPSCNLYLPENAAALTDPGSGEGALGATARLRLALRDSAGDLSGQAITAPAATLEDGGWHHAALVVTPGAGHKIYYDGLLAGGGPNGGDTFNPTTALFFGGRSVSPAGRFFQGSLDEIRLYDRPLLAEEIPLLAQTRLADTAPQVAAGADRFTYLGAPLLLVGLAADATPTGQLAIAWSRVSGPGSVVFADAGAPETSATFSLPGTYLLRLTANDGGLQASDELTVTVAAETTPGLVAQWTFDDGGGSLAADRAGLAHQGALAGAPDWIAPGRIGSGALRFRAAEPDLVLVDASPVLDFSPAAESFSVTAWLRLAPGKIGTLLARGSSSAATRAIHFLVADLGADGRSDLQAIVGGLANSNAQGIGPRFDDNTWHHVALVHDAAAASNRLYLDGAPLGAPAASGSANPAGIDLLIGARRSTGNTGAAQVLDGDLDDVRIYSRALEPAELALLFTGPAIPPCGPPVCLFGDGFELGTTAGWSLP